MFGHCCIYLSTFAHGAVVTDPRFRGDHLAGLTDARYVGLQYAYKLLWKVGTDTPDALMVLFPTRKEICEDEMNSQPYWVGVKSKASEESRSTQLDCK